MQNDYKEAQKAKQPKGNAKELQRNTNTQNRGAKKRKDRNVKQLQRDAKWLSIYIQTK